ncbi:MAG: hypothetical protein LBT40_08100 [Deltaproteobacteria bacterium]|jgi:hypothetical protein|nr:hypothetical protein [Deltaproteobacteria bacterium]
MTNPQLSPSLEPLAAVVSPRLASAPLAALAAVVAAALLVPCHSVPALAQDPGGAPPETYENQPPLTDDDIPALTEFLIDLDGNTSRWEEIVSKYQLEETRIAYIVNKYVGGLWIIDPASGFTEESVAEYMGTPLALPTPEELEVIRRNSEQVETARRDAVRDDGDEDGDDEDEDEDEDEDDDAGGSGDASGREPPAAAQGETAPGTPSPPPAPSAAPSQSAPSSPAPAGPPARDLSK